MPADTFAIKKSILLTRTSCDIHLRLLLTSMEIKSILLSTPIYQIDTFEQKIHYMKLSFFISSVHHFIIKVCVLMTLIKSNRTNQSIIKINSEATYRHELRGELINKVNLTSVK